MNEVDITLSGNAGDNPKLYANGARPFTRVNIACTPRIRQDGEWTDGPTQWLAIKAWGRLAENVAASVRKGDALLVTGSYRLEEYTNEEGETFKTPVVLARGVGFDLRRSRAQAVRVREESPGEFLGEAATGGADATGRVGDDATGEFDDDTDGPVARLAAATDELATDTASAPF